MALSSRRRRLRHLAGPARRGDLRCFRFMGWGGVFRLASTTRTSCTAVRLMRITPARFTMRSDEPDPLGTDSAVSPGGTACRPRGLLRGHSSGKCGCPGHQARWIRYQEADFDQAAFWVWNPEQNQRASQIGSVSRSTPHATQDQLEELVRVGETSAHPRHARTTRRSGDHNGAGVIDQRVGRSC